MKPVKDNHTPITSFLAIIMRCCNGRHYNLPYCAEAHLVDRWLLVLFPW